MNFSLMYSLEATYMQKLAITWALIVCLICSYALTSGPAPFLYLGYISLKLLFPMHVLASTHI